MLVRPLCPACDGTRKVLVPRAGMTRRGDMGTVLVAEPCKTCKGTGWLALMPARSPSGKSR